jgi:hypothetical protein
MPVRPLRVLSADSFPPAARSSALGASPKRPLPVLFGEPAERAPWRVTANGLELAIDVFGSAFYLLTRYEEVVQGSRDRHERFPASASLAAGGGFLDRPIVDEYVDVLWMAIEFLWAGVSRPSSTFQLQLTHDVDEPWATFGRSLGTVAHAVGGDFLVRRDPNLAARRAGSFFRAQTGRVDWDPFNTFDFLMGTSELHGLQSTFYFMSGNAAGDMDGSYQLSDPPVKRLLQSVHNRGHEIGLHASYASYRSDEMIRAEFDALKVACSEIGVDQPTWSVRQHYLRFENPGTWVSQDSAGLDYDSTLGFADQIGFRAGTCREYPAFDLIRHRKLLLRERPLLVMDATLFGYMGLDLDDAVSRTKAIVSLCRRHRGQAVILYHNSSLPTARLRSHYRSLVEELVQPSLT